MKIGLGDLSLTVKMVIFISLVGFPCFLMCLMLCVDSSNENEQREGASEAESRIDDGSSEKKKDQ